jgi:hypothetical protein
MDQIADIYVVESRSKRDLKACITVKQQDSLHTYYNG